MSIHFSVFVFVLYCVWRSQLCIVNSFLMWSLSQTRSFWGTVCFALLNGGTRGAVGTLAMASMGFYPGVPSVPLQWYHLRNDINGVLWVPLVLLDLEECLPLAQMVCSLYTGSYVLYTKGLSNNISQPKDTLDWGMGTLTTKGIFFYPGGLMVSVYIAALLYFYIASFLHCCIATFLHTALHTL